MMSSNEIVTLINALGTGSKDFNIDNLRYEKIIIMTDADVDGSHIRTLSINTYLIIIHLMNLIEKNNIYILHNLLSIRLAKGGQNIAYVKNDKELRRFY